MGALTNTSKQAVQQGTNSTSALTQLRGLIEKKSNDILQILGNDKGKVQKFQSNLIRLFTTTDLQKCSPLSVLGAAMQSAYLGLDLDPNLGEAYVLARKNTKQNTFEASFQTGYKGLLKLVRNSGQLVDICVNIVYEKEPFELHYTLDGIKFDHKPLPPTQRGENKVGAYLIAKLKDGYHFEWMWAEEILEIKKLSQSGSSQYSPWNSNSVSTEGMWKKTVVRRAVKFLPTSTEVQKLVNFEEADEIGQRRVKYENVVEGKELELEEIIEVSDNTNIPEHNEDTGEIAQQPQESKQSQAESSDEQKAEEGGLF